MNSSKMLNPEANTIVPLEPIKDIKSNIEFLNKSTNDIEAKLTNAITFTDKAWEKVVNEEVDLNAIYRRAKYLFKHGITTVEFDVKELEKWCKPSAFGRLSKYANPKLIPLEEGAWERTVTEKYGNSSD